MKFDTFCMCSLTQLHCPVPFGSIGYMTMMTGLQMFFKNVFELFRVAIHLGNYDYKLWSLAINLYVVKMYKY